MITLRLTMLAALAAFSTPAFAQSPASDDLKAEYAQAFDARMAGDAPRAEAILEGLVARRPDLPQLRFDLAVARAEQGQCAAAARTFARGRDMAKIPGYARAVDAAMADLCPRLAPFETELAFNLIYDNNINSGSTSRTVTVGGVPVTLSDDAVAQTAYGYSVSGRLAYNVTLGHTSYLVPEVAVSYRNLNLDQYDELMITPSLSYRYRGDRVDWRVGPTLIYGFDQGGASLQGHGIAGRLAYTIDERSGLYISASWSDVSNQRNDLLSYSDTALSARYVRQLDNRMLLSLGASFNDRNYKDDLQDLRSLAIFAGLSGSLTPTVGFDLGIEHRWNSGSVVHPFFGAKRKDNVTSLNANLSFAAFEDWWGRPYVGVSHVVSKSSHATKNFDRTSFVFGVTRSF